MPAPNALDIMRDVMQTNADGTTGVDLISRQRHPMGYASQFGISYVNSEHWHVNDEHTKRVGELAARLSVHHPKLLMKGLGDATKPQWVKGEELGVRERLLGWAGMFGHAVKLGIVSPDTDTSELANIIVADTLVSSALLEWKDQRLRTPDPSIHLRPDEIAASKAAYPDLNKYVFRIVLYCVKETRELIPRALSRATELKLTHTGVKRLPKSQLRQILSS